MARMYNDVGKCERNTSPLPQQPLLLLLLLLLLELLPITSASEWLECASSMCVECHQSSPTLINVYRWYSTGWFDCQTGSALSSTDYCRQQPQPFNATPPFSSIFSSEKQMSFGSDGGDPDHPFFVKIPFKNTNPMSTASLNTTAVQSAASLRYPAPALVHDIIPIKLALPMCVPPFPSSSSSFSSGRIGLSAPPGSYGLWLYIVDKRGLTLAATIANASVPRISSLDRMALVTPDHAFSAVSGCKYVYAVLYVATSSSAEAIELSFDWLPQALSDRGAVVSFDYLSADKFEFDAARVEGKYESVIPLCRPERCDGSDVLFDVAIDGLGGATLSLVLVPIGDVTSPTGIRLTPVSGRGYRVGNVLEFEASLFGGGSANLMVTVTGIQQVRQPLPLRLLSDFGSVLQNGVAKTDVWTEFMSTQHNTSIGSQTTDVTVVSPPSSFRAVSPRVAASQCSSQLSAQTFTSLANKPVGPSMSNSQFGSCRRVCGSSSAVTGRASISSSGVDRCGVPVFTAGDTASITCAEGHWLSSGTQQLVCQSDYSFSGTAVCSPLSCPPLAAPSSGSLLPSPLWQGRFNCSTHWRLSGSALLTCLSSGQWDLPAPTCVRVTCPPLLSPQYGRVLVRPLLNYSYGSTAEYAVPHLQTSPAIPSGTLLSLSCDLGFYSTAHRFASCEASGEYNATLGSCVPVPCNSFATLKLPPRAIAIPPSIRFLDAAVVTCESGYRFENGSAEIAVSCDAYGNVSAAASVPLCLRIPNFCEANPWACAVLVSWPFALAAVACLWFYILQSIIVTTVLPSTGDQMSFRSPRYKSLSMLPALARQKWALLPDEFVLRIASLSTTDDVVTSCRQLASDALVLYPSMMQQRLYQLKLPQLRRFWDFSPKLVLCVCARDDSSRIFVKRDGFSSDTNASGDEKEPGSVHAFAVRGAQRWRHIHSASLMSIAPSAMQPLPPARAAKVYSWMQSSKAAWELHDDTSAAWHGTFRGNVSPPSASAEALTESSVAEEHDLNRWVSKNYVSEPSKHPVLYEISVVTGCEFGAGTDSRVFCTLYGDDGLQSLELPLDVSIQNKDPFETGQLDTFRHVFPPIGHTTSVRIRYDATGFGSDWLLDRVRVKETTTGVVSEFEHAGWLSENTTSIYLQARNCTPSFLYEISVVTGSDAGAGTDSKVFCTLFGNLCIGGSGEFALASSAENCDAFEAGSTDTFQHISSRLLGHIRRVCIRHDASGLGSDWLLDRVRVKDVASGEVTEFEHGGWLTKENCCVELSSSKEAMQSDVGFPYEICVDTGNDPGSGTDSRIYCVLYGDDGSTSGQLALAKSLRHSDPFETGNTDTFRHILPRSLGRVDFVRVRHDATGVGSDWKLERVRVRDVSTGVTIEFDHGDWLTNVKKEVLLPSCSDKPTFPYEITVVTGKEQGAGTDAKVFCTLHGEYWGSGDELALASSLSNPDPFETGKSDTFRHFFPRALGRISSISVRFDATGFGADWLLDRVSVKEVTSGEVSEFVHGNWLTREKMHVSLEAVPRPSMSECSGAAAASEVRSPPALSLPGAVPDGSDDAPNGNVPMEALGGVDAFQTEPLEALGGVDAFRTDDNAARVEAASFRKGRLKRAADMLLRLGISRNTAEPGQAASQRN